MGRGQALDRPEYLRGPLRFYWVDNGLACGLVVVRTDVDAIVECAPFWRRWFIGRTLEELCEWNPDVRILRIRALEEPKEEELDGKLGKWKPKNRR